MVSRKSKIVFPVKVSSTHCGPVTVKFYELPFAERKIAKLFEKVKVTRLKKYYLQCCEMPRNFYFHTVVSNIFWVFNTLYLLN